MTTQLIDRARRTTRLAASLLALLLAPGLAHSAGAGEALYKRLESLSSAEREKVLIEGAKKEGRVVWYTTDSPRQTQILFRAFKLKYPFIDAQLIRGKSRAVLDRIITEYRAGRHFFDIAKTSTETFNLYPPEVFASYRSPAKDGIPEDMKGEKWGSLFTFVRAVAWNTTMLKPEEVPQTWENLLDPRWKGKILFDTSSLPEVTVLYGKWGKDRASDYIEKLGASGNLVLRPGRTVMTQLLGAGEAPLAVTVYPYDVEQLKAKGSPIDWGLIDLTPGLLQPNSISANAPNPHSAALLYDWLFSEGQEVYAKMGRVPASPRLETRGKDYNATKDPRLVLMSVNQNTEHAKEALKLLDEKIIKRVFGPAGAPVASSEAEE